MNEKERLRKVRDTLEVERLDAILFTHLPNIRYLCGFTGSSGALIVGRRDALFFTDGRYTEQAKKEVRGAKLRIVAGKSALAAAGDWLGKARSMRKIGIDPRHLTIAEFDALADGLPRGRKLVNAPPVAEEMRGVKDNSEIERIRKACHLGAELFDRVLRTIRPGVTESEVAGELEFAAREAGVEQMAFPPIIASGPRSALPHGRASSAPIPAKGFVVCDFGVILAGYCSDMTRTVHVGRPPADACNLYEAVQQAQQAALEAVRPGITVNEVDNAARKLLSTKHLAKYFTHSTGHGVGLEIHEAPRIAAGQNDLLKAGMVITIEPGVYIPGKGGVRIEDTVVVTNTGCEILTPCPKAMIVL